MERSRPNIVLVYADDLGRGMLSAYGQRHFATPNVDRLAREGVRFTNAYGCAFCAPARASLLTGYHDCHAGRWSYTNADVYGDISTKKRSYDEIRELINSTSFAERDDEVFLATVARDAGYVTGQIGKLDWGFATTPERLSHHGWDYHYGWYDHARCHGFYPPFLFEDGRIVNIEGNTAVDCGVSYSWETPEDRKKQAERTDCAVYSQDLFDEKIRAFIRENADRPFFLYHPSQLPHGPIAIPEIHPAVREAEGLSDWEREYASMVLRLDTTVGVILSELEDAGIADNTLFVFCSDNGHEIYYCEEGRCSGTKRSLDGTTFDGIDEKYYSERSNDVFNGNDGMAGVKLSSLEGGTRVPYLVRWPEGGLAGEVRDDLIANYDLLPTIAEIMGAESVPWKDGESFASLLKGAPRQRSKPYVVFAGVEGPAVVQANRKKLRYIVTQRRFQLFDLATDPREEHDLAAEDQALVRELGTILLRECDGNFLNGTAENHKALRIDEYMAGAAPETSFPVHPHTRR